ncbi:hypothetical protein HD554DRAFT_2036453 [Boletus coccyginus]|nr:hypothetical protein HD554DRAFT_2036453 [Boletus coccyginus]
MLGLCLAWARAVVSYGQGTSASTISQKYTKRLTAVTKRPDKAVRRQPEAATIELEGERKGPSSCKDGPTGDETATSGVSEGNEDTRNSLKKLQNTSQPVRKRLEQKVEGNSPSGAQERPRRQNGRNRKP